MLDKSIFPLSYGQPFGSTISRHLRIFIIVKVLAHYEIAFHGIRKKKSQTFFLLNS